MKKHCVQIDVNQFKIMATETEVNQCIMTNKIEVNQYNIMAKINSQKTSDPPTGRLQQSVLL